MAMKLIDKMRIRRRLKRQGHAKFQESVHHAMDGISYTITHERNFKIEIIFGCLVMIFSYLFRVSVLEFSLLIIMISLVLVLEMVNTAIERVVDLVTKDYHELAKNAKDVAAGAVFIASMFSVVLGIVIFLPKIIQLFR